MWGLVQNFVTLHTVDGQNCAPVDVLSLICIAYIYIYALDSKKYYCTSILNMPFSTTLQVVFKCQVPGWNHQRPFHWSQLWRLEESDRLLLAFQSDRAPVFPQAYGISESFTRFHTIWGKIAVINNIQNHLFGSSCTKSFSFGDSH